MRASTDRTTISRLSPGLRLFARWEAEFHRCGGAVSYMAHVIRRAHGGRWPALRALAMIKIGAVLYEAAQWRPNSDAKTQQYSVLTWNLGNRSVSWVDYPSARVTRGALAALIGKVAAEKDARV